MDSETAVEYRDRWLIPAASSLRVADLLEGYAFSCFVGEPEKIVALTGRNELLVSLDVDEPDHSDDDERVRAGFEMLRQARWNRLFACEQLLKGLVLAQGGKVKRGHPLMERYEPLRFRVKDQIRKRFKVSQTRLPERFGKFVPDRRVEDTLKRWPTASVELRYGPDLWSPRTAYEFRVKATDHSDYCNLFALSQALYDVAFKRYGEYTHPHDNATFRRQVIRRAKPMTKTWSVPKYVE